MKVLEKGNTEAEGIKAIYKHVAEDVEDLIGPLMLPENKAIKKALVDRPRVNCSFDILGLGYPNWPAVDLTGGEGGMKRKWGSTRSKGPGTSKHGRQGRGRGSSVDRPVAAKVLASSIASARPRPMALVMTHSSSAGGSLPERRIPGLGNLLILEVSSDEEEDEENEKVKNEGSGDVEIDGSSSDSSDSGSGDDDDDDDVGHDEAYSPRRSGSEELGF